MRGRRELYHPARWHNEALVATRKQNREATERAIEYLDRRMRQMFRRERSTTADILQPRATYFLER